MKKENLVIKVENFKKENKKETNKEVKRNHVKLISFMSFSNY